jgi:hypothetical protein
MAIATGAAVEAADILGLVSFETTAAATHSLTTIASEKVLVVAKGDITGSLNSDTDVSLKYNSVAKDKVTIRHSSSSVERHAFTLTYTETPGAATHNITVEAGAGSLANVVIMVIKLKQS